MACVELPRPRREERFRLEEGAWLHREAGEPVSCTVRDMSVTGARLATGWQAEPGACAQLVLDGGALTVPFEVVRAADATLSARFIADTALRRNLIAKLYTGRHTKDVAKVALGRTLASALKRLLG